MLSRQIKSGERPFKEVFAEMWGSLNVSTKALLDFDAAADHIALQIPLDHAFEVMKTSLKIDPGFRTFHHFCINHNIPFHVLSAGLEPVLRRVLDHYLGEEEVRRPSALVNRDRTLMVIVRPHRCHRQLR